MAQLVATMGSTGTALLLTVCLLGYVGRASCSMSPNRCSSEPNDEAPPVLECSEYRMCEAIAGDTLEIPCGEIEPHSEVSFTYRVVNGIQIERAVTLNHFLMLNVTASDNDKHVMCLPNNIQDRYCYKLYIEYSPQQIQGGAQGHSGYRNNPYCLSCQLESNPPPNCTWTIYRLSLSFPCFWDHSACEEVSNPPGGVSFPNSPEDVCDDPVPLPDPVYSGCVIKIDRLTEQYKTDNLNIMCTAENSHGTDTVDFQWISFSNCGGAVNDVSFSPSDSRIDITVGEVQTINCTITNAEPGSNVLFFHNGTRLFNTTSSYDAATCIRQISVLLNGTMYSDAGNYTCHFSFGSIQQRNAVAVNVLPQDCSGPVSDVRLSPSGPSLDVAIGETQTIDCTVSSAEPDSRVFLHHNGTKLLTTTSSYDAETCIRQISLRLNGTMYSDAGNYTCVFNSDIQQTSSVSVNVVPQDGLPIVRDQQSIRPAVAAGGSTGGFLFLVIAFSIFVAMYLASHSIKYYLKWRLREPEYVYLIKGKEQRYVFDVFLSFAKEDKEDTERLFKDPLETRGYQVCWHHDDFMPGRTISENISDNIENSRKILFVLSEDFFKSSYCMDELDASIRKLKKTKTRCVIPIVLKECEKMLPPDIKDLTYFDARSVSKEELIKTTCDILGKPLRDIDVESSLSKTSSSAPEP